MTEAFPLYWPEGRKRTPAWKRHRAKFVSGFGAAVNEVVAEVRRLGGRLPVISTNVPLRRDGRPLASAKRVDDVGVAVYFTYKDRQVCFACDRWDKVEDNIKAVAKTIQAMRGIARWGTGDMLDAAFAGFSALPPPSPTTRAWRVVLFGDKDARVTLDEAEGRYRTLAKIWHPDVPGGDAASMAQINAAIEDARREFGR